MTINVEVIIPPDEMDRAKRLLQESLAEHVNCRSSTVPRVESENPSWESQRQDLFWTQRLNKMRCER